MCQECGCGLGGPVQYHTPKPAKSDQDHGHDHNHDHDHSHSHSHGSGHHHPDHDHDGNHADAADGANVRTVSVQRSLLERNDRLAERNRGFFQAKNLFVINVLSSPGSGKTTLIRETARRLQGRLRVGVIVGDLATDNDASRLREAGIPVVQITTGTLCHLEADMIARAASDLDLDTLDVLVIENVGNLVCPASYDLGENLRVVLLSVTEGEDKPLKYPPMFHSADVALITKSDLAGPAGFERGRALANLARISHHAAVFEVSARTGDGLDPWCDHLVACCRAVTRSVGRSSPA